MVPIRRLLYIFVSFVFLFSLTQCEKDDICLNDNLNTPRIIIRFMDKENPGSSKIPNDLLIRAIDNENSLGSSFSDSIALPLYIHKDFTQSAIQTFNFSTPDAETLPLPPRPFSCKFSNDLWPNG